MRHFVISGLLIIAGLIPAFSPAANVNELDTIVVSATRSEQSNVPTPSSITTITRQQIKDSGATTLAQVLRGQGGIQIRDLYGDGSRVTIGMRGFGANAAANTLLLIDGRRLNNPDLAPPDLNNISLQDIERIEIIQGSAGTLFGDQAVGGVINIITRTARKFQANISAATGSYDNHSLSFNIADRLNNGVSYRLSAINNDSDNYRDNNERDYRNVTGKLSYEYDGGNIFIEYQDMHEDLNLPGGLFRAQFDVDRRQARFVNDKSDTDSHSGRLGIQQSITDNWYIEVEYTERSTNVEGMLSSTDFTQQRQLKEFTPRLIGSFNNRHGEILLTLGADIIRNDYEIVSMFGTTSNDQRVTNAYIQAIVPLSPSLKITVGARAARVENDLTDSFTFPAGIELDDSQSAGELGISLQASKNWRVYARLDENFRFAKIDEHTSTLGGIVGLDTQTGQSYELGSEWRNDGSSFKVVFYRLNLNKEIDFDTTTFANRNLDATKRGGVIIEASHNFTRKLNLAGQFSAIDAKFKKGPFAGNRISFVARNTLHLSANYQFYPGWSLFGEMQYIGDRVASGDIANSLEDLDGYTVVNMNLKYRHENWLANLRINNLTDKKYSNFAASAFNIATFLNETAFYAAPERNVMLTIQYDVN